ncbi:uncharacterized protein K444DRAFT_624715 [Hyaloscypha bicolor E]|uniref:Uncharacterized protein n=1 Tax=Hyaloscypha bicolor E TaxID=1095630 RepID=A0A2J6TT61_9HELO|nr:uncharacterized protein K444DRAFT_624715 [Hyaloscypha bicolor E]PMD66210.1 hypothetical protein K444DRAFT_624715 [Hyaloscypha bicolor E]
MTGYKLLLSKKSLDHPTSRSIVSSRRTTDLSLVRYYRVEIRREGDTPSNPIIILEDTLSVTVAPDTNTPPQSPPQRPEKRPRPDRYNGIARHGSSRKKKRRRGGSRQNFSPEKIDSLNLSDDPDHSASRSTSGLGEMPSPSESAILEEHSLHLPVENSAFIAEESPQHVSPVPETFPTQEKADPAAFINELATTLGAVTGSASSIILSLLPEANTQPECPDQTCPLVAYIHLSKTIIKKEISKDKGI